MNQLYRLTVLGSLAGISVGVVSSRMYDEKTTRLKQLAKKSDKPRIVYRRNKEEFDNNNYEQIQVIDEAEKASSHSHEEQVPQPIQESVDPQDIQALGIVMFHTEGCGWCKKTKEDAEGLGIMPYLELQDIGTPKGKAALQESGIEFKGAPTFYSKRTNKSAVGYGPFNQLISMLTE